jgi:hypothetical protein
MTSRNPPKGHQKLRYSSIAAAVMVSLASALAPVIREMRVVPAMAFREPG